MRILLIAAMLSGAALAQRAPIPFLPPQKSLEEAQLAATIGELQSQLANARRQYTDKYPAIVSLQRTLADLQDKLAGMRMAAPGKLNLPDRWWNNPAAALSMGLTADQQKKMDGVFEQFREQLTTLSQSLEQEEYVLKPLIAAPPPDDTRITSQIDRIAQARAALEKANGRMLLGLRKLLTAEQWIKLNQTR